jgi:glycosyltransferase involved in cell wall biosynthesis
VAALVRVLQLTNMWPRADCPSRGIFCKRQVDGVRQAGVDVDVLAIEGDRSRWKYVRAAFEVTKLNFRRRRYSVIHAHTGHCGVLAALQFRLPVVLSYVGYDLDTPAEDWENWRTRTERFIFRYLSLLFAVPIAKSERGRRHLPARGRSRAVVLPNGIDREIFAPIPRDEARRRLGWHPTQPVVLFVGDPKRFTKGFPLAEQSIELARRAVPDLELVVASSVLPDEMPLWMNAADALILTSVAEGSPNVVKEAMACNLPIVTVDVGDVREVVEGTRHSRVCVPDPDELGEAIVGCLAAAPSRSDGRKRTEHLGLELISLELARIYERAAMQGAGVFGFVKIGRRRRSPHQSRDPFPEGALSIPPGGASSAALQDRNSSRLGLQ